MNALRLAEHATTFALDIPSGVDRDTGEVHEDAVVADFTLTVGYAKPGLVVDAALDNVGRISVVPFPEVEAPPGQGDDTRAVVTATTVGRYAAPPRIFHPQGHGRARCDRRGVPRLHRRGLALCHGSVAGRWEDWSPSSCPRTSTRSSRRPLRPRSWSHPIILPQEIDLDRYDVLAAGPGMGVSVEARAMLEYALHFKGPMVIDADGLNLLACGRARAARAAPPGPRSAHSASG